MATAQTKEKRTKETKKENRDVKENMDKDSVDFLHSLSGKKYTITHFTFSSFVLKVEYSGLFFSFFLDQEFQVKMFLRSF